MLKQKTSLFYVLVQLIIVLSFFIIIFIIINGCVYKQNSHVEFKVDPIVYNKWIKIDDNIDLLNWPITTVYGTSPLEIFRLTSMAFKIFIKNDSINPKNIVTWSEVEPQANIIINGSYYLEDNSPAGYLMINRERVGELIFDQEVSGAVVVNDNQLEVRDLAEEPFISGEKNDFVLQSFPFLIKNGLINIKKDSNKVARRTAIGIDNEKNIYLIILSHDELSLYRLAQSLKETGIDFVNVLNLDGGSSTGLVIRQSNGEFLIRDSLSKIPNVIIFSK